MRKGILTMIVVLLLSATPCLAAELEFPQVDELWEPMMCLARESDTK